jgi:hypothetical protein
MKKKKRNNKSIVFRPGLVQDPDFDRVARVNFFLNQNDVVLVIKKKSTGCNRVFDQVAGLHRVFPSPFFSSTRPDSSPGSTRQAGLDFKTMNKR